MLVIKQARFTSYKCFMYKTDGRINKKKGNHSEHEILEIRAV